MMRNHVQRDSAALTRVWRVLLLILIASLGPAAHGWAQQDSLPANFDSSLHQLLQAHCLDCHQGPEAEAQVRLDQIDELDLETRLKLLNRVQDQVFFELMPPTDAGELSKVDRKQLLNWTGKQLRQHNASELDQKREYPAYGNLVDHEALFRGEETAPAFTPARRWRVSPQIFLQRVNDVFGLEGRARRESFYGVTNPFVLPERSGVRDYDHTLLDGGHLLVMLNNARWIAEKQVFAAVHHGQDRRGLEFPNPRDRWLPPSSPDAFVRIVRASDVPSQAELVAAIETQFQQVLRRPPTEDEQQRYLTLFRSAIDLGGNVNGLKQTLASVLLESEFLYRHEMGTGPADEHSRQRLAPQEAAQAIAYALGDRGPDEALLEAAASGRLNTADDFRREVRRLLADDEHFAGPVDPGLSGKNMKSHNATHPKLVRFFREFFGYPMAVRVFKDIQRSDGYYQNPGRGTSGTPGFLVKEADRVVDWALQHDEHVFEQLLTTEEFFVYHDKDNETGREIIQQWQAFYDHMKDTRWRQDPEGVIEDNLEFIQSKPAVRVSGGKQRREFLRHMYFFEETLGRGITPFTTVSFAHGYAYHHSPFYNLPPTPGSFRYGGVERENFPGLEPEEFWDYPVEQPFKIPHRKGLLTHPAWLIAHSSNFQTNPVTRGRWIREKLLAGFVPDVPITVDARVPDDPDHTFGERLTAVTKAGECWKCHRQMNPLGLPFEVFDDFGRYRLEEPLEYPEKLIAKATKKNGADQFQTRPVISLGELEGTGDEALDGAVQDPFELIDRLAASERVRQSIIRYAFRFFLGRNERLSDAQTLIDADQAYVESGGSFRAVVVSLLSSESFRYRKDLSGAEELPPFP